MALWLKIVIESGLSTVSALVASGIFKGTPATQAAAETWIAQTQTFIAIL